MIKRSGRERPEKILVAMHQLSHGDTSLLKYEDIVVKAFELFPDEFALRGYSQYPDSSDVHKPLYGVLKAQGLIRASQKRFGLTSKGVEIARHLLDHAGETLKEVRNPERLTRDIEKELDRMLKTEAYRLFVDGHPAKILDTDFYAFFACTVRTSRSNFSTRLNAVENALEVACKLKKPDERSPNALAKLLDFLKQRFSKELSGKVANHVA